MKSILILLSLGAFALAADEFGQVTPDVIQQLFGHLTEDQLEILSQPIDSGDLPSVRDAFSAFASSNFGNTERPPELTPDFQTNTILQGLLSPMNPEHIDFEKYPVPQSRALAEEVTPEVFIEVVQQLLAHTPEAEWPEAMEGLIQALVDPATPVGPGN